MHVNRDAWRMHLISETYKNIEKYEKENYRKHVVRNISSGHLPKANKGILLKTHSDGKTHSYSMTGGDQYSYSIHTDFVKILSGTHVGENQSNLRAMKDLEKYKKL